MRQPVIISVLVLALAAAALALGGADPIMLHWLTGWRADRSWLTGAAADVTQLGGSPFLLALTALAALALAWRRGRREAGTLLLTVISGRLTVELLKWLLDRPRPAFEPYPVAVSSMSLPSGHAANSMITFLAIALLMFPGRRGAIGVAIAASLIVGATRPLLGVHWPSDVLAGWAFGLLWATAMIGLFALGTTTGASSLMARRRIAMTERPRDDDNALIDELTEDPTPGQGSASGGDLAREIGQRDEFAAATGEEHHVTRVRKGDKPRQGDEPTLPNRNRTSDD